MSQITAVRAALLAALGDDLTAEVLTGPQEAMQTFGGGLGPPRLLVRVYVGSPDDRDAQERLDTLLDPDEDGSIAGRLYADQELGDFVHKLQIVSASGWRVYEAKDGQVLGAEWTVQTS